MTKIPQSEYEIALEMKPLISKICRDFSKFIDISANESVFLEDLESFMCEASHLLETMDDVIDNNRNKK